MAASSLLRWVNFVSKSHVWHTLLSKMSMMSKMSKKILRHLEYGSIKTAFSSIQNQK